MRLGTVVCLCQREARTQDTFHRRRRMMLVVKYSRKGRSLYTNVKNFRLHPTVLQTGLPVPPARRLEKVLAHDLPLKRLAVIK